MTNAATNQIEWIRETGLTKESQTNLAAAIVDRVNDGSITALDAKIYLKSAEAVISQAQDGIDYHARREAEQFGERSFLNKGVKIELAETGIKYDYKMCGDPVLDAMETELADLKKRITARQKFLQGIAGSMTIVDEKTGEILTLYPPVRSSNDGLKISFK